MGSQSWIVFSALYLDYFEIYGFGIVEGKGNAEQRGSWEWARSVS